jgi:hypothetical protein
MPEPAVYPGEKIGAPNEILENESSAFPGRVLLEEGVIEIAIFPRGR